jgi:small subunit ribosomal protein S7
MEDFQMSRRTTAKKRLVSPDPIYRSRLVSMMMSRLLQDGKKSLARRLFYESMEQVERLAGGKTPEISDKQNTRKEVPSLTVPTQTGNIAGNGLKIFQQAVLNVTPVVEVKSRRVGGSNYQVPLEVNSERGTALALRWLVQAARQRPGREMAIKLANELIDASNKTGNAIRKREETHRMAEANKAFANYRF